EQAGQAGPGFRFQFGGEPGSADTSGIFSDLLGGLFGGHGRRQGGAGFQPPPPPRGQDVEVGLSVSLEEVDAGATRDITVNLDDACTACGGSGVDGAGRGCRTCHGRGVARRQETLRGLVIPAGVEDEAVLRVRGKGGRGPGGDGDLLLRVSVREHPFFVRRGEDLECEVPISLSEAVLGAEVPVPTLRGTRPLKLKPGTQSGQRFRIQGYGLPSRRGGGPGNLMVKVRVVTPREVRPPAEGAER
ncbi:MAG: hypothetical protein HYU66_17390, partial [Armatimonadetes bacterium]|nr:hypothetical protein [Armatimonadota bacterium]